MRMITAVQLAITTAFLLSGASSESRPPGSLPQAHVGTKEIPQHARAAMDRERASVERDGFIERPTVASPTEVAVAELMKREEDARNEQARSGARPPAHKVGYLPLSAGIGRALGFAPGTVPETMIDAGSTNVMLPGRDRLIRIYTSTALGPMIVRELKGTPLVVKSGAQPFMTVGVTPVYVATVRYARGAWGTVAMASSPTRLIHVDIGRRLDTPQQQAALRSLLTALVRS